MDSLLDCGDIGFVGYSQSHVDVWTNAHRNLSVCFISKDVWPLLISIFAAHLQHAHANGLFNNGLHFEEVKRVCGQEQNVQLVR